MNRANRQTRTTAGRGPRNEDEDQFKGFPRAGGRKGQPQKVADAWSSPCTSRRSNTTNSCKQHVEELSALQRLHYASNRYALLLIFQAMDAAGKDGAIRHVMSGVNPQGCQVFSFKHPSATELEHDFLWRTTRPLPERGRIGIFNRSYYEEVLIVRVHPEILRTQGLPDALLDERDHLEGAVSLHRGFGKPSLPQRNADHKVLPSPVEGRAAKAIPRAHR